MDTATGSSKRTRFDATAQLATPDASTAPTSQTPIAIAERHIKSHVMSLLPSIANILETTATKHILLLAKAHNKRRHASTMENDDEYIPRSARVKFELLVSKKVDESPAFAVLREETATIIMDFQKSLKSKILAATKLEVTSLETTIKEDLAKAICIATRAFLIADGHSTVNHHRVVNTLLDRHHEALLKHATTTLAEFRSIYKEQHGLDELPPPFAPAPPPPPATPTPRTHENAESLFAQGGLYNTQPPAPPATAPPTNPADREVAKILRALDSTFIVAWDIYQDTQKKQDINLELKKLSTTYFTEAATEDTQMEVDAEGAVDPQQLKELVRKQAQATNKKLNAELSKLKSQFASLRTAKNTPKGPRDGALQKEKTTRTQSRRTKPSARSQSPGKNQKRPGRDRKAAAASNDSNSASSKGRKKPNARHTSKKKKPVNTGKNKQSGRSRRGSS
jgi:hypothetical protein